MAVNRKYPEYVILVDPITLQPYVASGGGGGVASSVKITDSVGTLITAGNPFPVTGTVTVSALPALPTGANTIGAVTQAGSPWGVKTEVQSDFDSGAGTQNISLIGLALPANGGAVIGGTASNPLVVNVNNSPSVTQSGAWNVTLLGGANTIGKVDQGAGGSSAWKVDGTGGSFPVSGSVSISGNVTIVGTKSNNSAAPGATCLTTLPALANAAAPTWFEGVQVALSTDLSGNLRMIGAVTQSGTWTVAQGGAPWSVSQSGTWNVTVNTALPTGTNVIGGVTQSGTWTVQQGSAPWSVTGNKTNNNAAPGATNVGTLPVLATAAAQTWVEGNQVALSADLAGNLRVGTHAVTQSGTWTVQQGGAPWSVAQSGTWNVTVNTALPTGTNVIGGVTQSGTWSVQGAQASGAAVNTNPFVMGLVDGTSIRYVFNGAALDNTGGLNGLGAEILGWDATNSVYRRVGTDASGYVGVNLKSAIPAGANTIGAVTGSGVFNVRPAAPAANDYLPVRLTDGASFYTAGSSSGGGTSMVDQAPFTEGTTPVTPVAGVYDDAAVALTAGVGAAHRMTSHRAMHANLRSEGGTEIGTSTTPLVAALQGTDGITSLQVTVQNRGGVNAQAVYDLESRRLLEQILCVMRSMQGLDDSE